MLDHEHLFSFNFLKYGGIQTGDHHGMRYRLVRVGDKPDFELQASVWPEPFAYETTQKEQITEHKFPYTPEGREQAIDWMIGQYETRKEEWDRAPSLLTAFR